MSTLSKLTSVAFATCLATSQAVFAAEDPVKILVLDDMRGIFSGNGGPNTLLAVQMAVEDFDTSTLGTTVEVLSADHQNKADVGSSLAQRFIDEQGVDAITFGGSSAVGLAVQGRAADSKVITMTTGGYAPNFVGDQCSPYGTQWAPTTRELARGVAGTLVDQGLKDWYFITADYVFGRALSTDAADAVVDAGGGMKGETLHPLNTNDMASALLAAQASGADVVGLANAGSDTETAIKQARSFGVGDKLAALLFFSNNAQALTLDVAQGIRVSTSFYWNMNDTTKAWAERFMERNGGQVPTMGHANAYAATTHYLKSVAAAKSQDAAEVTAMMHSLPIDAGILENASIQENGRVVYDMLLAEVKAPSESTGPTDLYKILSRIDGSDFFLSAAESGCPLVN